MKIVICGSSGLIGSALVKALKERNHTIIPLINESNKRSGKKDFVWNVFSKKIDIQAFSEVDCVINLAGTSISKPWSKKYKQSIYDTRIEGAKLLFDTFKQNNLKPKRYISASGTGIYPDPTLTQTDESPLFGDNFLSEVCLDWEKHALKMKELKIETSIVRTGLVLSNEGGLFPIFSKFRKLGFIPTTGSSKNKWSWIHIDDIVNIYIQLVEGILPEGIYNGVAPNSNTQEEIARTVFEETRKNREHIIPFLISPNAPAFVLKLILGERSILTLTNQDIIPKKLIENNFTFSYPTISSAIHQLIHVK